MVMPQFVHLSRRLWRLDGRMSTLASPGYEQILKRLVNEAMVGAHRRERAKHRRKCYRAHVTLQCSAEAISLFHNARSGYRAQYYSSMTRGELANRFALTLLVPHIREILEGTQKRTCPWWWMEKSLLDPAAKIWIHQGQWLRLRSQSCQNLIVMRWLRAQHTRNHNRRKKARWSMLTPAGETCLELMGGFLSLTGASLGSLKKTRSKELHELGFT
jgi:hypothetical protein